MDFSGEQVSQVSELGLLESEGRKYSRIVPLGNLGIVDDCQRLFSRLRASTLAFSIPNFSRLGEH